MVKERKDNTDQVINITLRLRNCMHKKNNAKLDLNELRKGCTFTSIRSNSTPTPLKKVHRGQFGIKLTLFQL